MGIRAKSFRNWMKANFTKGELQQMAEHGADTGWHGHYSETIALYDKFEEEIWDQLYDDMEYYGADSVLDFLSRLQWAPQATSGPSFKNYLVWYMAETVANRETADEDELLRQYYGEH